MTPPLCKTCGERHWGAAHVFGPSKAAAGKAKPKGLQRKKPLRRKGTR